MWFSFCSKKYISSTVFLLHEPHCRRNIVLCDQCGEAVPRTLMEEHKQEHEEVPCQQCRTLVPRGDMEIHLVRRRRMTWGGGERDKEISCERERERGGRREGEGKETCKLVVYQARPFSRNAGSGRG